MLPSPNGSRLTIEAAAHGAVFAGCLRNARVTAHAAQAAGDRIGIVAAGERWPEDDSLRPCLEDLVGAGAIVYQLTGHKTAMARAAAAAFVEVREELVPALLDCHSGRELIDRGYTSDVRLAATLNAPEAVAARLVDGAYRSPTS